MKLSNLINAFLVSLFLTLPNFDALAGSDHDHRQDDSEHSDAVTGPNGGRLFKTGDFSLELQLFEQGTAPEYRVFIKDHEKTVAPTDVDVTVILSRLGGKKDTISFKPDGTFLKGTSPINEPHSFSVKISATYQGEVYEWHFDNFEGRTQIAAPIAKQLGINTNTVQAKTLTKTLPVYGKLALPAGAKRQISARFDGEITKLTALLGMQVKKGQHIMTIQSNDSLQSYRVISPINGIVTKQNVGLGEQTAGRSLIEITDMTELVAELQVFPNDAAKISQGAAVSVNVNGLNTPINTTIKDSLFSVAGNQAKTYRVFIPNPNNQLQVGQFVSADITLESFTVPMAIEKKALHAFRDFNVVFAKFGDQFEVRMLTLGRSSGEWVEVLSGIDVGSEYATDNSYILKADIEKSGASHDH
ncbi:efflux RND transporter periplasmic adaptor subunit [Pseudoalteromonas piratica]|uniref:Secretion protein HlyD n=1 Tax=Pseudoalteromonas piratica TaxID=1348114 RepID=A0A0A7EKQ1_9GAMM|nr:efflux RND transporter periplasmic adaptor subunit [Pseudoalteromonas piratica]AIY66626.1 secretion protein HlyD [Pseudoalteromonas piratica]